MCQAKEPGLALGHRLPKEQGGRHGHEGQREQERAEEGVGFVILAVTTLAGLDLVRGNALKVLLVLTYIPITLLIFGLGGKVAWAAGFALAAGNLLGGLLGVRLTVLKGHLWVKRVVTLAIVAFALKLWLSP